MKNKGLGFLFFQFFDYFISFFSLKFKKFKNWKKTTNLRFEAWPEKLNKLKNKGIDFLIFSIMFIISFIFH